MPIEEDIKTFQEWATSLGCPQDAVPNDDALKSVFKSRQRELFCNLMKFVQPRQVVQEIKQNILINKLDSIKDQVVPMSTRNLLPQELQLYLEIKDLKKKRDEMEERVENYKRDYDKLAAIIKTKNIQNIQMEHKYKMLCAKVNLLELKSISLDKEIAKEQDKQKQILATMPVKLTAKNASENAANDAVDSAIQELENFYNIYTNNSNPTTLQMAKDDLWQKLRTIFSNVPNFLLFNVIMRLKEEQLQNIIAMNKSNCIEETHINSLLTTTTTTTQTTTIGAATGTATREPLTPFEVKLLKTKADFLGIVAKCIASRNERIKLEERFANVYATFVDELKRKVEMLNVPNEQNDEIISAFIVQYNLRNFNKSQNEYLTQQIEQLKLEIEYDAKQLQDHEVMLGSIKQIYNDINASINRIQYEMLQLGQIKDKILYSKNMLKHLLADLQPEISFATTATTSTMATVTETGTAQATTNKNCMPVKMKLNDISLISVADSFDLCNENLLCSTKLDMDNTMTISGLNNTTMRVTSAAANSTLVPISSAANIGINNAEGRIVLPAHLIEIQTFVESQMDKYSCIKNECAFYLSPNPLVIETHEIATTLNLAPGILLTSFGAIEEIRKRILWADLIATHSKAFKLNLDLINVDENAYKASMKQQRDQIVETLDKIQVTGINTKHLLEKLKKFYDFMLENPLRHYIPATKMIQNQNYAEYEGVYMMYYMIANGKTNI